MIEAVWFGALVLIAASGAKRFSRIEQRMMEAVWIFLVVFILIVASIAARM